MMKNNFKPEALEELLSTSGASYKRSSASFIFNCPRCGKKDKLYIRRKDGVFICFYCAETDRFKGRCEYALVEILQIPLIEIKHALYGTNIQHDENQHFVVNINNFFDDEEKPKELLIKEVPWPLSSFDIDAPEAIKGANYLIGRGIPLNIAKEYGVRFFADKQRVAFPIYINNTLIGWQARAIFKTEIENEVGDIIKIPKIITSPGVDRNQVLMFSHRLQNSEHAVLCEGPVDALACHLCGGNVATMGKIVSHGQLQILREMGIKKLYIALDPDANHEAMKIAREMGDLELYRLVPDGDYKDLGECPMEHVKQLFDNAPRINGGHIFVHFKT